MIEFLKQGYNPNNHSWDDKMQMIGSLHGLVKDDTESHEQFQKRLFKQLGRFICVPNTNSLDGE